MRLPRFQLFFPLVFVSVASCWIACSALYLGGDSGVMRPIIPRPDPIYKVNPNTSSKNELEMTLDNNYNVSDTNFDDFNGHTQLRLDHLRERKKLERLHIIQTTIIARLGLPKPNSTKTLFSDEERKRIMDKFKQFQKTVHENDVKNNEEVFAERVQSFYPSCVLPRNMDRDFWEDPDLFHVYYDVSVPRHMQGTSINVSSAKLRLFKTLHSNDSRVEDCHEISRVPIEASTLTAGLDEERYRISVFQYVKPLRKSKGRRRKTDGVDRPQVKDKKCQYCDGCAKKKLLESKMVLSKYEGWVEFNIRSSIREWLMNGNRNFGLEIVVENAYEHNINPTCFFQNMNCSTPKANDPPFPRFMEDDSAMGDNESAIFDTENETYPTLDLHTVVYHEAEIPLVETNETEQRRKRQISCDHLKIGCCHESTYVSFRDLGWEDWIIEPKGFLMGYCLGSCNSIANDASSENSLLEIEDDEDCVPDETAPIQLSYVDDEGNEYESTVEDFLVQSCQCK